ncbi:glycine cleavage system protein H [Crossiella cryophila]|uniref:Glycine cleavage system H protein n=1 Tax=Crossiella cryophila TaxID=43355 RepID=A0A7W7FUY0_9PSEU|nr:glycine cleavage system protein H [Crossiella cryophila]MBB4679836.1 glycine cleavage system H protein [Crossiella cryophila]
MIVSFEGLQFTADHNWVRIGGDTARIGITACFAERLTGLCEVRLPRLGEQVQHLAPCGLLATSYWTGDLFTPVTGTVTGVNQRVIDAPELVRADPYGAGWLFEADLADQPARLLDGLSYLELTSQYT